jgi:succinyl-diaminopimelate desuccinylase
VSANVVVEGVQGHVAYPDRAANPAPVLVRYLAAVQARMLDEGYPGFQPSNLEITSIDIGNPAGNVIPARASARLNVRFNPAHTGASLSAWLRAQGEAAGQDFNGAVTVTPKVSGEAFLTEPGSFTAVVAGAVEAVAGVRPELSTTGGTSDARFIRALCPVVEFGLVGATMHKVDEQASVADIRMLTEVYERIVEDYFSASAG